jgi:hypothetical protein
MASNNSQLLSKSCLRACNTRDFLLAGGLFREYNFKHVKYSKINASSRIWEGFRSIACRYNLKVLVTLIKTRTSCGGVCFQHIGYLFLYVNKLYCLGKTKINEIVVDICRMVKKIVSRKWTENLHFEGGKGQEFG